MSETPQTENLYGVWQCESVAGRELAAKSVPIFEIVGKHEVRFIIEVASEAELNEALTDLDRCLMASPFPVADQDGEHDLTDRCSSTAPDTEVDDSGCSQQEFREAIEAHGFHGLRRAAWPTGKTTNPLERPETA